MATHPSYVSRCTFLPAAPNSWRSSVAWTGSGMGRHWGPPHPPSSPPSLLLKGVAPPTVEGGEECEWCLVRWGNCAGLAAEVYALYVILVSGTGTVECCWSSHLRGLLGDHTSSSSLGEIFYVVRRGVGRRLFTTWLRLFFFWFQGRFRWLVGTTTSTPYWRHILVKGQPSTHAVT